MLPTVLPSSSTWPFAGDDKEGHRTGFGKRVEGEMAVCTVYQIYQF